MDQTYNFIENGKIRYNLKIGKLAEGYVGN